MARTHFQALCETNGNFTGWLLRSSYISAKESECVIKLRKNGLYAGHNTLEDLKSFCLKHFNPFQVPLQPGPRIATKEDDDAGAETHNLRFNLKKLDIFKDNILNLSMEKNIPDKQEHVFGPDMSEGNLELQGHDSTKICSPIHELKRTDALQCQLKPVPYTVSDPSKGASQAFPKFRFQADSSGDCAEFLSDFVDSFFVTDANNEIISLFDMPYEGTVSTGTSLESFHIHGTYESGLSSIMLAVTTWKLELGPESYFCVKTCTGKWIRLGYPTESYAAGKLRTALVVKNFLSFVNLNQAASEKEVLYHLQNKFRFSEVQPSLDDVLQHTEFVKKLLKELPHLDHSMVIYELFKKRKSMNDISSGGKEISPKKSKTFSFMDKEVQRKKNLEDKESKSTTPSVLDNDHEIDTTEQLDESDEKELGDTICAICDDGGDILCCDGPCLRSFHATEAAAAKSTSHCASLHLTEHEVKEMSKFFCWNCLYKQHQCFVCGHLGSSEGEGKEVFVCDVALCGRFYHLQCVSKMLGSVGQEAAFIEQVKRGSEVFSCPLHKCSACKKGDIKGNEALRLYSCRRCPRAWHKQCISDKITFYEGVFLPGIRGWEMDGMRFLYCLHHEMDEDLGTPIRDHLAFPDGFNTQKSSKEGKLASEKVALSTERAYRMKHVKVLVNKKFKGMETGEKLAAEVIQKPPAPTPVDKKKLLGALFVKTKCLSPSNGEVKKMVESVIDMSKKAVTIDTVIANLSMPNVYKGSIGSAKKNICLGKLDSILHALAKSHECFLRGAFEEARCIFPEDFLQILERSKNKLRVYLAPILYGQRYISYGRHFTKLGKLKEVVDRVQWYVDDGDMVVDFCCGSNNFSRLMDERLKRCCKRCEYKNFDIIQPKHEFNFTKRDWLSVKKHELLPGDRLIMGLNPPFGVLSQLANMMVHHALTFKPKLLILIVPKGTKRLEEYGYECIWEDPYLLSGQAFYLPGSVDINGRILSQENNDAPHLYLWSRSDWAIRHHDIASKEGHLDKFILQGAELIEPTPEKWSTGKSEAQVDSNTHERIQNNDMNTGHPDGVKTADDCHPFKARNSGSEIPSGILQNGQISETCLCKTSSNNVLVMSQTFQQDQLSSHYRRVVGLMNKDQSEIQEPSKCLQEQAEDLNVHPYEEITPNYQFASNEEKVFPLGGLYAGGEALTQKKDCSLDRPRTEYSRGNLKAHDREFFEFESHDRTGGWLED